MTSEQVRSSTAKSAFLVPIGSSGDVHPFIWIGKVLQDLGWDVTIFANAAFRPAVERSGARCVPMGEVEDYERLLHEPALWDPVKGPPTVLRYAGDVTSFYFDALKRELGDANPVIFAPSTAFGARLVREVTGRKLITVNLQPCIFLSVLNPPVFGRQFDFILRMPVWLRRLFFQLVYLRMQLPIGPGVNRACRDRGVRPPRNAFRDWWQSPDGSLCLFPDWFAPRQPDWPAALHHVGFPLYDLSDQQGLDDDLRQFLADGDAPILFTAGTAMTQGAKFFRNAVEICVRLGKRGLLLTKYPAQIPDPLPASIRHVSYAPFSLLLPSCAAIVHHGGIGTTSQALAAGVPQLIMPMAHDQPDNAARVVRLGVGDFLYPSAFDAESASAVLGRLTSSPSVREACDRWRDRSAADQPAEVLRGSLERLSVL